LRDDRVLGRLYVQAFGCAPPADDETALVDAGKALAAYQETLASERTPFDDFRDALARGDLAAVERYPVAAQRGLRVFVGRGGCLACHAGPSFSDGEFHSSRVASRLHDGSADAGRALGLAKLRASAYARSTRFSDGGDPVPLDAGEPARPGAFRTPALRQLLGTAPYMHDGSAATLCEAVAPHADLDDARPTPPLTAAERRDVVAFLRTLDTQAHAVGVDDDALACR
ncbi:MAG: hypothetical protein JO090_03185, partial [Rhizobacter sp.]|nr:hypothetical protein [Rhizobacter sp.]